MNKHNAKHIDATHNNKPNTKNLTQSKKSKLHTNTNPRQRHRRNVESCVGFVFVWELLFCVVFLFYFFLCWVYFLVLRVFVGFHFWCCVSRFWCCVFVKVYCHMLSFLYCFFSLHWVYFLRWVSFFHVLFHLFRWVSFSLSWVLIVLFLILCCVSFFMYGLFPCVAFICFCLVSFLCCHVLAIVYFRRRWL